MFSFFIHKQVFIKIFVHYFFVKFIFLKNYFNKFISCIFTSINNNWLSKPIINTKNFIGKTTRNMVILFVFLFLGLKYNGHKISMKFFVWFLFLMGVSLNSSLWLQVLLVLLSGDVEINPGPKHTPKANLSICHWNI